MAEMSGRAREHPSIMNTESPFEQAGLDLTGDQNRDRRGAGEVQRAQLRTATRASSDAGCLQSSASTPSNAQGSPPDPSCCAWPSLMAASETCVSGRGASAARYCVTVSGTVVLVVGTVCFAWWSEEDAAVRPGSLGPTVEQPMPKGPETWLKSVSFLCCGLGSLLLLFGLLWSIQESTKRSSQGDLYRLSRDLYHLAIESSEKEGCRIPASVCYLAAPVSHLLEKMQLISSSLMPRLSASLGP